jgi:hypothetical protein
VNSENNGKLISQRRNHGSMKADGFQVVPLVYTPGHKRAGGKKKKKNGGETEMKCARWRTFFQSCDFHKACLFLVFLVFFIQSPFLSVPPPPLLLDDISLFISSILLIVRQPSGGQKFNIASIKLLIPVASSRQILRFFFFFPQFLSAFHQWKANQSFPYGYRLDPTFMKEADSPAHSWQSWNWQLGASLLSFDTGKDPDQHADELSDYETKDWWGTEPQVSPASTDDNFHLSETRRQIGQ